MRVIIASEYLSALLEQNFFDQARSKFVSQKKKITKSQ
jgi:hypothetical protein